MSHSGGEDAETVRLQIGPYLVLQRLGEGGMGTVYLAEQREPVRRRVALKVLKPGMDGKAFLARFDAERQVLAMMEHSCIARVLDAGAAESGQPYLAMEYVKGEPITDYCDEHKLSLPERLELFRSVCSGVQHAHTKGVMHRDLKPSNVLITVQDGRPTVKIIDFGLAKAVDHRLVAGTLFTAAGEVIGTPEYMSPEQAGVGGLDVDMRTDVYSLGVLLYQLMTGALPMSREELLRHGWLEMQRLIREGQPKKPSTKVTTLGMAAETFAKARQLQPGELGRRLRGDLDWIVMKALEKDRGRRYETVQEFSADLLRHLRHEPVTAGPPTPGYLLKKMLQRYRAQVLAAAAVLLALGAGLVVAVLQRNVAKDALERYRRLEDGVKLRQFEQSALQLVPEGTGMTKGLQGWVQRADAWIAGLVVRAHEATLANVRQRGRKEGDVWRFDDDGDQFLNDALQELIDGVARFQADHGTLARVRQSLDWSMRVNKETIDDHRAEWNDVATRVQNNPVYRGLLLPPQEGLVPIGEDQVTGYEEFWMPRSGTRPEREKRRLVIAPDTGIVMVLLPGGDAIIGSPDKNPAGRQNELVELPRTKVVLAPFLIGKYELTQGQWIRLTDRDNPSRFSPREHKTFTLDHPVERVSWNEVVVELARVGLDLPTEPQWEYACRAGKTTEWWFGDRSPKNDRSVLLDASGLCRFNAADGYLTPGRGSAPEAEFWPQLEDGYQVHAPVGKFEPNGFGLYDVHGNVSEMTRGALEIYNKAEFAPGTGEILRGPSSLAGQTSIRGGSWYKSVDDARCARRTFIAKDSRYDNVGVRVARRVEE